MSSPGIDADPRRRVPRTDVVLSDPRLLEAATRLGPAIVKAAIRDAQDAARDGTIRPEAVTDLAIASLPAGASSLRPVINATGVILHTNLGRAQLSSAAVDALCRAAGYTDVEYDVTSGTRARRGRSALAALEIAVPDAAAVHVVNNGAAALLLAATALAAGREIVVSRGELVEIGDGFRLPDLLVSSGARLREVGTTNRTALADYRDALGTDTGFILKIHPSNFVVSGFTSSVDIGTLASLGREHGVPVVADIGSGLLRPDTLLPDEPDASSSLRAGASLVTASGDKLLGGPQAGLLVGSESVVDRLRRHPMARALRVDKLTLAALEATLAGPVTPTYVALHADSDGLRARADAVAVAVNADVVASTGLVGGGGAPGVRLDGWAVSLPEAVAGRLRLGDPCIVARTENGRCLVDLRCVDPAEDAAVITGLIDASR